MVCGECVGDDKSFADWSATIIGPANTNFDNRIYFLSITCHNEYPDTPPRVQFQSKVNLPCVNKDNGRVEPKFSVFANWNKTYTMEKILVGLKSEMVANKKLPQPNDGEVY